MRQAAFSQLAGVLGNHAMSALVDRRTPDRGPLQRRETPDAEPADVKAQTAFNPLDILHKLTIAIDQSDVDVGGEPYDRSKWKRKVDFPACVAVLKDRTAAQVTIIREDYYRAHEKRKLDEDLFGGGESGFPTNLKVDQILQLGALLGGTKAAQAASDEEKRVAATNDAAAQAAELHSFLHGKLDKGDRDQVMVTLRRGPTANATVIAAYQRLYGVALGGDIARLGPVEMVRATLLLAGNVGGADAYKVNTLKSRITGIDEEIAKFEDVTPDNVLGAAAGIDWQRQYQVKQLREERQRRVEEIEQLGEQVAAEAQTKGQDAKAAVGAAFGNTEALASLAGGKDAIVILGIAWDDPAVKAAAQIRKLAAADDLTGAKLTAALRGLRAAADERARRELPPGDPGVEARTTALADQYFARLRTTYDQLVPEGGDHFDEIVAETGNKGDETLNTALWVGAGRLEDVQELVLALSGKRKDTAAVERVLKGKSAADIQLLKNQYIFATGGRSLDYDLFGMAPTAAGGENPEVPGGYLLYQGKAEGTSRLNLEDYLQRPNREGGIEDMWYTVARAEREYEYTIENGGATGAWRDAWGNEQRSLLDETIKEVRRLKGQYLVLVGWNPTGEINQPEMARSERAKEILEQLRLARHTIRGDHAAYEKATAELRATFQAIATFVIQAALTALLAPLAAAMIAARSVQAVTWGIRLAKWSANVVVGAASTVGANAIVMGNDYSLDMLRRDLQGALGGAVGGVLAEKLLGPVAKGLVDRLGPKASHELIEFVKNVVSMEGSAAANGDSLTANLDFQSIFKEYVMGKAGEAVTGAIQQGVGIDPHAGGSGPGEGTGGDATTRPTGGNETSTAKEATSGGTNEPMAGGTIPLAGSALTPAPVAGALPSGGSSAAAPVKPVASAAPTPEPTVAGGGGPGGTHADKPPGGGSKQTGGSGTPLAGPGGGQPQPHAPAQIRDAREAAQILQAQRAAGNPNLQVITDPAALAAAWRSHGEYSEPPLAWIDTNTNPVQIVVNLPRLAQRVTTELGALQAARDTGMVLEDFVNVLPTNSPARAPVIEAIAQVAKKPASELTVLEFATSRTSQEAVFTKASEAVVRQKAFADSIMSGLGIEGANVESILKRPELDEFVAGVVGKCERNGYTRIGQMDDIIRGRINVENGADVARVVVAMGLQGTHQPVIQSSTAPRFVKGTDEQRYPRYHVIVVDAVTGLTHEWQIGTKATSDLYQEPGIRIPDALATSAEKLKKKFKNDIHDIEYDLFQAIAEKHPEVAAEYGLPKFIGEVATASNKSAAGASYTDLPGDIKVLHEDASVLLERLVSGKGGDWVAQFFH